MPALTKSYETFERPGIVVSYRVSNVKIYKGSMVGVNSTGWLVPMSHATASLKFVGVANETVDNSTGTAGAKSATVTKSGSFCYPLATGAIVQADIGKEVFMTTDWEIQLVTTGLTTQYKGGTVVSIEQTNGLTGARIRIDNYSL